ncbi:uncharacterized protein LOC134711157 [Mytilus trossulus]|uniref:uncharacterized protein LOC134711157 n=1 Tax=Mytilus trossulus TaxID=6551 RepID=UPI0030063F24
MQTDIHSNAWQSIEQSALRIHIPVQLQENQNRNKHFSLIECSYRSTRTCILIIFCIVSSFLFLGILGYSVVVFIQMYEFSLKIKQVTDNGSWRYKFLDETSLCFSLRREDVHHSDCGKYLYHDISDRHSFTCCLRDSSQYALLYGMLLREQTRRSSGVENTACTHGSEKIESTEIDIIPWLPVKSCQFNGQNTPTHRIQISDSNIYYIYLSVSLRFKETYQELPYNQIRITLIQSTTNSTFSNTKEKKLISKVVKVPKERYSFENIFIHGEFRLNPGDSLYVNIHNKKYLNTHYSYIGIMKI